jgi:hypothetical protein
MWWVSTNPRETLTVPFQARSQDCEKRLLASPCLSVCKYVCPSVRPSVRMVQLGSHWTHFYETWYLRIFRKSVEKIHVSLKSNKDNGSFAWRPVYICYCIPLSSSYNEKCFRQNFQRKSKHTFYRYVLESKPHPFYSFRGLKKSDAD